MNSEEANQPQPTDETLVRLCRRGNMTAFGELTERYQHRLFNAIFRVVAHRDDAQELTQETFVRALQGLKRFRGNSSFYTWLFRIGINLSINHRRRRDRMQVRSFQAQSDIGRGQAADLAALAEARSESPVRQAQINEGYQLVLAAMEQLDPEAKAVVVLRDIEQLAYAEIGQILRVPVGTVKSRLFRARMTIREKLLSQTS